MNAAVTGSSVTMNIAALSEDNVIIINLVAAPCVCHLGLDDLDESCQSDHSVMSEVYKIVFVT